MESNFTLLSTQNPNRNWSKKLVVSVSILAVVVLVYLSGSHKQQEVGIQYISENQVEQWVSNAFKVWSEVNEKSYGSSDESTYRLLVFRQNLLKIKSFQESGDKTYNLSLNGFADLTQEEFRAKYLTLQRQEQIVNETKYLPTENLPEEVDWVRDGAVSDVKNQGRCGSCWAFSAIAAIEGLYAQTNKEIKKFSEQQLVDCNKEKDNDGCNGGFMNVAFEYISRAGIEEESDYPYKGVDQKCKYQESKAQFKINGYNAVPQKDLDQLRAASAQQVISVAVEVNFEFQFYSGGVFHSEKCGQKQDDLNHGVALVGYGSENGKDFWTIKNSWGAKWGSNGYMKISRQAGKGQGTCGIAFDSTYPVL